MSIDFASLLTPHSISLLVGGAALDRGYLWLNDKYLDHKHPEDAPHVTKWRHLAIAWVVAVIAVLMLSAQSEATHNQVLNVVSQAQVDAKQVKACQSKMTAALNARDALRQDLVKVSDERDDEEDQYVSVEANPPADIAALHTTDPLYQEWSRTITQQHHAELDKIRKHKQDILDKLASKPLPSTSCE